MLYRVCLIREDQDFDGENVVVSGFGANHYNFQPSYDLKRYGTSIVNDDTCKYQNYFNLISQYHICSAQETKGYLACQGDDGGK